MVIPITRPKAIIKQLWLENDRRPSPTIGHVAESLRQIAKFYVGCQPDDVLRIATWGQDFGVKYKGMTTRNRKLLEQITTASRRSILYRLPETLILEADNLGSCKRGALAAQRAVWIELLLKCPMRLANVIGLRIEEHLQRPDPKTNFITAIIIPAHQTKK